jgi:reverse transcriptase-like protein
MTALPGREQVSVTVLSDHANLRFFMTTKELNRGQARWAEQLSAFDFQIEHRPGNNPADAPSRRSDYSRYSEERLIFPTLQNKLQSGFVTAELDDLHSDFKLAMSKLLAHGQKASKKTTSTQTSPMGKETHP